MSHNPDPPIYTAAEGWRAHVHSEDYLCTGGVFSCNRRAAAVIHESDEVWQGDAACPDHRCSALSAQIAEVHSP